MSIIERSIEKSRQQRSAQTRGSTSRGADAASTASQSGGEHASDSERRMASFGETGLLVARDEDPNLIDEFRRLKNPVLQNAFGRLSAPGANIVMVCSALSGDGKTFSVANLAYALSLERDLSVVMLDLDNARGSLTAAMGLQGAPGFFDAIQDPDAAGLDDVIVRTEFDRLSVIPTGTKTSDTLELLNSRTARDAITGLANAKAGTLVLMDTPPVLSMPDGSAIMELAGQVLVVVAAGQTSEGDVQKVLNTLDKEKPVGLVLNKAPRSRWLDYYGGDYYASTYY